MEVVSVTSFQEILNPAEPAEDCVEALTIKICLPKNQIVKRRFFRNDPVQGLIDVVGSLGYPKDPRHRIFTGLPSIDVLN